MVDVGKDRILFFRSCFPFHLAHHLHTAHADGLAKFLSKLVHHRGGECWGKNRPNIEDLITHTGENATIFGHGIRGQLEEADVDPIFGDLPGALANRFGGQIYRQGHIGNRRLRAEGRTQERTKQKHESENAKHRNLEPELPILDGCLLQSCA